MSDGQLALNTNLVSPGLFFKDSNGDSVKVGPVHVGTTAPNATPGAGGQAGNSKGEQWLDTSSSRYVFKIWDGTAWRTEDGEFVNVSGDTMTGALGIIAGTAAAPGVFFSGDTNTGIYSPGADQVAVATNGAGRLYIASDGKVGIGTSAPGKLLEVSSSTDATIRINDPATVGTVDRYIGGVEYYTNDSSGGAKVACSIKGYHVDLSGKGRLQFATGNETTAMTINGSQQVGIGTTSPGAALEINAAAATSPFIAKINTSEVARIDSSGRLLVGTSSNLGNSEILQVNSTSPANVLGVYRQSNDASGPRIFLGKTRGSETSIVQNGDIIADIRFVASDGVDIASQAASIGSYVDGTPGANDMPGRLVFSTTADGASSPTERMRITSAGLVGIGTSSPGAGCDIRRSVQIVPNSAGNISTPIPNGLFVLTSQSANNSSTKIIGLASDRTDFYSSINSVRGSGSSNLGISFSTSAGTAPAERMTISPAGNVGIGTTSPLGFLHIESPATTAGWQLRLDSVGLANESGFYRSAADNYEMVLRNGLGGLSYLTNTGGASTATLEFNVQGSERARIDSSGRLLVGTSTALTAFFGTPVNKLAIGGGSAPQVIGCYAANQFGPRFDFIKSRSATVNGQAIVSIGDGLGELYFGGSDGTAPIPAARIICQVDGTPGTNDMPGRLMFDTTADGASSPTERMRITSAGLVGIGTTSPNAPLEVLDGQSDGLTNTGLIVSSFLPRIVLNDRTAGQTYIDFRNDSGNLIVGYGPKDTYGTRTGERLRIDSGGRLLVGMSTNYTIGDSSGWSVQVGNSAGISNLRTGNNSSPSYLVLAKTRATSAGSFAILQNNDIVGDISFAADDGTDYATNAAKIRCEVDGTPGANDMPGRLVFSTTADGTAGPAERMRIDSGGRLLFGTSTNGGAGGLTIRPNFSAGAASLVFDRANTASTSTVVSFENNDSTVGTITHTNTATAYNTSSDYRLKENVVPLDGAIARLNQIPVHRFNFIADPDTVVDGFIAHEAQEVVPECVTGTKDEVDDDGNPVMQGIDQSKLVPLLTAALQEAIAKIEVLEQRLNDAGIN